MNTRNFELNFIHMNFHHFSLMHPHEEADVCIAFVYHVKRLYFRAQTKPKKGNSLKFSAHTLNPRQTSHNIGIPSPPSHIWNCIMCMKVSDGCSNILDVAASAIWHLYIFVIKYI